VRIIAPIPGRDVVGIETSNSNQGTVYLKDILSTEDFWDEEYKIPLALGKKADGNPMVVDLRKMPHLLVAGSTGSGKSVFVVSTITSLLMRYSPEDLRLIMVDPKQVDLAAFEDLPHLILPIIKEPKKAISSLRWAIREMDKRYRSMAEFGARKLEEFNGIVEELSDEEYEACEEKNEILEEKGLKNKSFYFEKLPYIVIIVEEFGDLMAVDKSNVEAAVVRLAQMARACGIHLILAMQSPRKDVVTGIIKTNIPGRISFKVASKMDSRIILDESGGERLLARGDMLFLAPGVSKPMRAHGSWAPEDVITSIVDHWKDQGEPEYLSELNDAEEGESGAGGSSFEQDEQLDDRYDEILAYVSGQKTVSASLLQRKFRLGYPRAARLIEDMESQGVIGPPQGSKPRQVLVGSFEDGAVE
jgi:S-DNA-T family DNA segregation ATPase FtsK/SpoIIIE